MIYSINYADEKFEKIRLYNTKTAYSKGKVDKVIEYSPSDIDKDFISNNSSIFSYKRGADLWLWKPYIILKTLELLKEGDYLFYADAGSIFVNRVQLLIDVMERDKQSIMVFELPLLERQFTKKETFKLMEYDNYSENQVLASFILMKKNSNSINFVNEWLKYMQNEKILSPDHFCKDIIEFEDFYSHREDQSVLSILARINKLPVYRDPSDYGDRPWQYYSKNWEYNPKTYNNSPFPKIIISNRKVNPIKYLIKEKLKTFLCSVGIYTEKYYISKINNN